MPMLSTTINSLILQSYFNTAFKLLTWKFSSIFYKYQKMETASLSHGKIRLNCTDYWKTNLSKETNTLLVGITNLI